MDDERKVRVWGGIGEKKSNGGKQWYIQNRIFDSNGVSPALTTYKSDYWIVIFKEERGVENYEEHKE